jgi:3-deoxy-D-manno-octulosonate 8-phosphate phosphatase (KDO 8-P phosphatase)
MTDGGIYYSGRGEEFKKFNTKDGYGIVKIQRMGIPVGIITGRVSKIVAKRAEELEITEVHQNQLNKIETYEEIKKRLKLTDAEIAYMGDDEPDLDILKIAGFSAAPADSSPNVIRAVDYVPEKGAMELSGRSLIFSWARDREGTRDGF